MNKPKPKPTAAPKKKNVADMGAAEYQKMVQKQQREYEKMVREAMKRREKTKKVFGGGVM